MANLLETSPAAGLLPLTIGTTTLAEVPMGPVWAVAPYRGKTETVSKAMRKAHGLDFPNPGQMQRKDDVRIAWSGLDQGFLMGAEPDAALSANAALTDQSDAWTHLSLSGPQVEAILARLVPVDLSLRALPADGAIRTSIGHVAALILRTKADTFELLVFRSMAGSAVHEIERAMRAVAAREALARG